MPKIHLEYFKQEENQNINDLHVINYINSSVSNNYDEIIQYDGRWSTFFNLSEMRQSILNWYEFNVNSELLEIGGGMGALTGLFCEKCSHVTTIESSKLRAEAIYSRYIDKDNLDIYVGDFSNIQFEKKFDYITVIGELNNQINTLNSDYCEFLSVLKNLLKPNGKLLMAIENKFGLKYWCGSKEEYTGVPFEGINGYPNLNNTITFSKKELERLIYQSGFKYLKFYYPMPDYKLPQIIYSENHLPKNDIKSRLLPYYLDKTTILASEMTLYDEVIENNVFEFFSNSFLVECSLKNEFCSVNYAAVTTDRPLKDRFSTTIHENNLVKKTPLSILAQKGIEIISNNLLELQFRGLKTVPFQIVDNTIIMPFLEYESFESYLKRILVLDKELFTTLLDRFYDVILKTSDFVDSKLNVFFDKNKPEIEYGPILKKAYIDLIPNNCFFFDDDFIFFDQEFVKHNYPANYIMFRTLKYTYSSNPNANNIVPLEEMKHRFKLQNIWDTYEKDEIKFVEKNRNYSLYKNFLQWTYLDPDIPKNNVKRLMRPVVADILVSKGFRNIAIYGFGNRGSQFYEYLKNTDINVKYAIDQNSVNITKERYVEIPVIHPDESSYIPVDAVVVSVIPDFESISVMLKGKVKCPVISLENLLVDKTLF